MTIVTTRWRPVDTCSDPSCDLEYSWDNTLPEASRVHTLTTYFNKCTAHQNLSDAIAYTTVKEENPRKNMAYQHILDNSPNTIWDLSPVDGTTRILKNNLTLVLTWSGTVPNRVLILTLVGISLTTNQKNVVQNALNTKFGIGKVTFVN